MTTPDRYHALDAVRGFALLAGIVLHATMSFFLPIPTTDSSPSRTLAVVFFVIHTFRMTLFFLVAGFFARFLLERRGIAAFLKNRTTRILAPMVVGWLILSPLTGVVMFWSAARQLSPEAAAAVWATWPATIVPKSLSAVAPMQLWFLYYLCMFYLIALGSRRVFELLDKSSRIGRVLDQTLAVLLSSYFAAWVLGLPLFALLGFDDRLLMSLGIPTPDTGLVPQVPALVAFGAAFLVGWFVHRQTALLEKLRNRWIGNLAFAMLLTVLCLTVLHVTPGATTGWFGGSVALSRAVYAACYLASIWYWTFGITGAALRFCAEESATRRYLADSSYWFYLMHLPLVFFLQVLLAPLPWHWAIKFPLIVSITLVLLLLSYHYWVRPTWIGRVLNGRRYSRWPVIARTDSVGVVKLRSALPSSSSPDT